MHLLRSILILACLLLSGPAFADDFTDAVAGLNAEGFKAKAVAVDKLAAIGDARALPVLEAMAEGRLYLLADGKAAIGEDGGARLTDAATGQALAAVPASDLTPITLNNMLRSTLRGAIGRLGLFSPDAMVRQRAAEGLVRNPSPEAAAMLKSALAKEQDEGVKAALLTGLAASQLSDPDKAERLAAIKELSGALDPQLRSLLQNSADSEKDAEVKQAAQAALAGIEGRLRALDLAANLFQGISLGSVLLLAAIGLAVTFGVMGVINMAHGEMIMLGAYTAYMVQEAFRAWIPPQFFGLYLPVAVPAAFAVSGLVGIALERGVIRFLYGRPLETLLATWGISLMLQQLVRSIFGAPNKEVANPGWLTGGIDLLGGVTLTYNRIAIILFCLAVLIALAAVMRYSSFGLHMRAVTQNRGMAAAMGIPTGRVDALTFGLGSGIAGIAGVALSQIGNVSPNLGQGYIVDSFMVVVFGGVGSLWGTLLGALSLGLVNKFLEPYAGAMLGKIIMLVVIILFIQKRPRGLFALKGRSVEA